MMTTNELQADTSTMPAEIQTELDGLAAAKQRFNTIMHLLDRAKADREQAAREHTAAFQELASNEAAIALDGAAANPKLRKAALSASEALTVHDARIAGIEARINGARAEVDAAMRTASEALQLWTSREILAAREEFWRAADAFLIAASQPLARGIGLGDSRLTIITKNLQMADNENLGRNFFTPLRTWDEQPKMLATVRRFGGIKTEVNKALSAAREAVQGQQQQ
jgi:hypothetical protein